MNTPFIHGIGLANPPRRFSQEDTFQMAGYTSPRILEIFRNCDIDYRHLYVEPGQKREETPGELNERYLRGAMETGCHALAACFQSAQATAADVDLLIVFTSTGYLCPDLASRLIGHMGFRRDVQRAAVLGLGCAGALPALQRACDFVKADPRGTAAMLAVEICSACYFVDGTMDTVVGNAICADGAAAFLISGTPALSMKTRTTERGGSVFHFPKEGAAASCGLGGRWPAILDFESYIDSEHLDKVGFDHRDGKLTRQFRSRYRRPDDRTGG